MEVLFGAEPCKKECKKESPPNLCYGKCCGTCKEGSRGYEFDIYCEKYEKWIEVEQVCDDWEEVMPSSFIYDVSGTFEVTDEQYTQMFGINADTKPKFTFTFPIPISCIVRNDDVFYNDCWIGKVNESDASKVDVCNMKMVSCNRDGDEFSFEFRQVE
jgi:hypothetical protein